MKEESRKILNELLMEHSKRRARPTGLSDEEYESIDNYNYHEDRICEFLKSIPQIESHLSLGGYIASGGLGGGTFADVIEYEPTETACFRFGATSNQVSWLEIYAIEVLI